VVHPRTSISAHTTVRAKSASRSIGFIGTDIFLRAGFPWPGWPKALAFKKNAPRVQLFALYIACDEKTFTVGASTLRPTRKTPQALDRSRNRLGLIHPPSGEIVTSQKR